ncbi:isoleucine--tRNA ligase [bacterium]|nr:isoleucine--tRNA ligase [bacterium]MBT3580701.1 isoleucine--tRNA ligase [bacterium]MBT4551797.1 isoleucine--tRNA ligase [bacterium]MBT5988684.1 isoleucine--tRNA ligase [bacterium]MBT7088407.1 isoleucine--tRNA ligase [bacterium]
MSTEKAQDNKFNIPEMQQRILDFWDKNHIFEKSVTNREQKSKGEVVFYDGPPFPTGTPHHGTVLVSFIKDFLARYFTMRGYKVPRVWGWDCHGLPIEVEAEKKLHINNKNQIEKEIGIHKFNETCKEIVSHNNETWRTYIREMARWVDYDVNSYKTMDRDYMETVMWVFKTCYDKDLIYKDYRVTPYCYRCETSLSISDTRESDSTRPKTDPSLVLRFKTDLNINKLDTYLIAWTTTPWTLPSNLALAVGNEIDYVYIKVENNIYILAEAALKNQVHIVGENPEIIKKCKGSDLVGLKYEPLFDYFKDIAKERNYYRVISADFVDVEEGVGIVHTAPAFGEDDYWVCRKEGIKAVNPVDDKGCFTSEVKDFAGQNVHDANKGVIRFLKDKGSLIDSRTLEHNYPHCWRCKTPLIYKAMDAWYFSVEKIKEKMLEQNRHINWVPETVKMGRFGNWLKNARDWNISRNRYWSTPIPIWECGKCQTRKVFGSLKEIETAAKVKIGEDIHRQYLDKITFDCECGGTYKRVAEVLDCWFETGAMPYAQNHYPFEKKEWFQTHFPASFIVEYTGQIRCWFYYLHVLAVALFDKPAFENCVVHGTLLAKDGKKISKSTKNYTDPLALMHKFGTDAMRLYLFGSPAIVMGDLCFDEGGIKQALQQIILPLWNAYSFFDMYAKIDNYSPQTIEIPNPQNIMDKWILAKLCVLEQELTIDLDKYRIDNYMVPIIDFMDDLTNWYIRRTRNRFWATGLEQNKKDAYQTLHYVLINLCKILAPCAPIIAEEIYKNLTTEESIHLSDWPQIPTKFADDALVQKTTQIRKAIYLARSIREKYNIKSRQPLASLQIVLPKDSNVILKEEDLQILKEELNVKKIIFVDNPEEIAIIKYNLNWKLAGPKLGKDIKTIAKALQQGTVEFQEIGVTIKFEDKVWNLDNEDIVINYIGKDKHPVATENQLILALDIEITEKLKREGVARDLIRHIQEMRKNAGYQIMDKIKLQIEGDVPTEWEEHITNQTLATMAIFDNPDLQKDMVLNELSFKINIKK